ncbi:GUN4 domain-containing protein [Phormidesmis sp. 146-35]
MLKHRPFSQNLMVAGLSIIGLSSLLAPRLLASSTPTTLPQSSKQPSYIPDTLRSQSGIDYAPLQQLLQAKKWQEANQLTSVLVLKAARQEQQGYLRATDTRNLACSDLKTVDRLWKAASGGRFGFSTQATIWRNLKGTSYEDSLRFEQQVGWNSDLPPATVPAGFYPFRPAGQTGIKNAFGGWWIREMPLRLKQCGIN